MIKVYKLLQRSHEVIPCDPKLAFGYLLQGGNDARLNHYHPVTPCFFPPIPPFHSDSGVPRYRIQRGARVVNKVKK